MYENIESVTNFGVDVIDPDALELPTFDVKDIKRKVGELNCELERIEKRKISVLQDLKKVWNREKEVRAKIERLVSISREVRKGV